MANYKIVDADKLDKDFADIANSIRAKNGTEEVYKPSEMAGAIDAIETGGGEDSFYDAFWDGFQNYGERRCYKMAFANGWTQESFKPKYVPIIVDPTATNNEGMFSNSKIEEIDCVDFSRCTGFNSVFSHSKMLKKITINNSQATSYNSTFMGCSALTNLTWIGKVTATITLQVCPLVLESAINIISCLEDIAGTGKEFSRTVTFSTTTWALLDAEGETASPNGNSWREYINDKGWNAS